MTTGSGRSEGKKCLDEPFPSDVNGSRNLVRDVVTKTGQGYLEARDPMTPA